MVINYNQEFQPVSQPSTSRLWLLAKVSNIVVLFAATFAYYSIRTAINAGLAREFIRGNGVGAPPASTSLTFTASQSHPLATRNCSRTNARRSLSTAAAEAVCSARFRTWPNRALMNASVRATLAARS